MLEDTYLKNALIPERYKNNIPLKPGDTDFETFKELDSIRNNIKEFVDSGKNLLICSNNCGNGKTTWSIKLLKAYIKSVNNISFQNNTPALFVNVNSFLNEKKLSISDPVLLEKVRQTEKNILSAKLVVFDDIADKSLSEYDLNTLYYWLDYRTANMKSCIYTTNQLPSQLEKTLSGKVYSRVVNYSIVKKILDGDHRGSY